MSHMVDVRRGYSTCTRKHEELTVPKKQKKNDVLYENSSAVKVGWWAGIATSFFFFSAANFETERL